VEAPALGLAVGVGSDGSGWSAVVLTPWSQAAPNSGV
jgi:hypothetical protein